MLDALIKMRIAPLIERLAQLETEVEDLRRRGSNQARIGTVFGVDPATRRCRVSHGELSTPWIKYFNPAAGEISETRHPSIGEQCLLINYAGGDGSAQSLALLGIESGRYPGTSDSAEVTRRTYPDGTEISYDHAAHRLNIAVGPSSIVATHESLTLTSNGAGLSIDAAGVHLVGPAVDHNGKNVGADHKHLSSGGPGIGGEPA